METSVEELSPSRWKVRVTLPAEETAPHFDEAYRGLQRSARIPGFRPGKVPLSVIRKRFGDAVRQDVGNQLLKETFPRALEEHSLKAIGAPALEEIAIEEGTPFSYSAQVDVLPDFELQGDDSITLTRREAAVEEGMIDATLERMRQENAQIHTVEEKGTTLAQGQIGVIDFEGRVDGEPFDGGSGERYPVEVGAGVLFPEFENGIEGMTCGESREISVDFPDDYHEELAGKTALFTVTLHEIQDKVLPEIDDEFAKDLDHDDLATLREEIGRRLLERIEAGNRGAYHREISEHLLGKNTIEVPPTLFEGQLDLMVKNQILSLIQRGVEVEDVEAKRQELREELRPEATKRAQLTLILDKVAEVNNLEVSDQAIQEQLGREAVEAGVTPDVLRQYYESQFGSLDPIHDKLREEIALDHLLARATFVEATGKADE